MASPPPVGNEEYEKQLAQVSEVWSKPPTAQSLWQSKIYQQSSTRLMTRGTAPNFLTYVKMNYLHNVPAPQALSIGCGFGDLDRQAYQDGLFQHCLGLDIAEGAIRTAAERAKAADYPIEYAVADLNNPAFRGRLGPFDLIYANASLHHVGQLEQLFSEIAAVLKPDGLFFFHEYVGPSRFQWRPKTLDIANRIQELLPERLHPGRSQIGRMTFDQFVNGDPSESVHSEEIPSIARMFFNILEEANGGTTLTNPLLNDIIRYFDEDHELEGTILRLIFLFEEILMEENVLDSDYKLIICRKRNY